MSSSFRYTTHTSHQATSHQPPAQPASQTAYHRPNANATTPTTPCRSRHPLAPCWPPRTWHAAATLASRVPVPASCPRASRCALPALACTIWHRGRSRRSWCSVQLAHPFSRTATRQAPGSPRHRRWMRMRSCCSPCAAPRAIIGAICHLPAHTHTHAACSQVARAHKLASGTRPQAHK